MAVTKPVKRIAAVDIEPSLVRVFLDFVADRYDFQFTTDRNAPYVFHSCFGHDVYKYSGVRVFITGENVSPHFGISDYAMGFEKMQFGDRYIRLPLIKLYRDSYPVFTRSRPSPEDIIHQKKGFCAYVMSNTTDSAPERTRIFDLLSAYKTVSSGGGWRNNVGGKVRDKMAFQSAYKFVIAFENTSYPGYLTEKFAHAAASNAVPIYWGEPDIGNIFNPKAFINCHDFSSLEEAVAYVKEVDQSDDLYRRMLSEPWFPNGIEPEWLRDATYADFLANIFDQEHESAYRRDRGRMGIKEEKKLRRAFYHPELQMLKNFQSFFSRVKKRASRNKSEPCKG